MGLDGWVAAAGDLLLGAQCPGCDGPGWGLCLACQSVVRGQDGYLTRPDPCPRGFPLTATTSPYASVLKRLISAHKERQVLSLTPILGERLAVAVGRLLAERALAAGSASVVLVPVPSAPSAVRARGFDATWAMAKQAARSLPGGQMVRAQRMLTLSRRVQDQAGLGAAARRDNLAGSFRLLSGRLSAGCVIVIVDDVVTTGSSLTEAARVFRSARIPVLGGRYDRSNRTISFEHPGSFENPGRLSRSGGYRG